MKYPRFYTLFLLLLISNVVALSQHPVLKYLSEIPPLPDNICNEIDEKIMKWNDILLDIKNKVETLKVNEEQVIAEAYQLPDELRKMIFHLYDDKPFMET